MRLISSYFSLAAAAAAVTSVVSDSVRPHRWQPTRQGHWSGLPFPSPMHENEVAQSFLTLSDPMDCSPPGSSVHWSFQAGVLEWGATHSSPNSQPCLLVLDENPSSSVCGAEGLP